MAITTATLADPELTPFIHRCLNSWGIFGSGQIIDGYEWCHRWNTPEDNLGVTGSLQWCYEHTVAPIIAFIHSDCELFEQGWDERALREFDDPKVGVVGFGGALEHGHKDLYKVPYQLSQLARFNYLSNTNDAETHGQRFTASCDVAVLDGFALIARRGLLDRTGGWPVDKLIFHSYDYWLCCSAHELDYRVRVVGIKCNHYGGATSTTPEYQDWCLKTHGKTDGQIHEESHKFIYERFRKVLPWKCIHS